MTIVIPYKDEVHKGLELKYALRSIEKNLTGWDDIWIMGRDLLGWIKYFDPISWSIADEDYPGRKEYSVYRKLLRACDNKLISENFIYWNDDHFLLKPLHVSEIKYWHNGPLEARNVYNRELEKQQNTLKLLDGPYNYTKYNYDVHTPIIFNKHRFKKIFEGRTEELCVKSLYANYRGNGDTYEVRGEFMDDCKILGYFEKEQVRQIINGHTFFSTNAICQPTIEVLEELFPDKSRFEL